MNHHNLSIPVETLEHIIQFIQDPDDTEGSRKPKHGLTLLTCALVCRIWVSLARRRLLAVCFPLGRVTITSNPVDFREFVNVFQSPLCTLDPTFIKTLQFLPSPPLKSCCKDALQREFFLVALRLLDATLFPSIQQFEFIYESPLFSNESGSNFFDSPSLPVLSQIKSLDILYPHVPFEDVICTVRLCPFIEELSYHQLPPPESLRKLILNTPILRETTKSMILSPTLPCRH